MWLNVELSDCEYSLKISRVFPNTCSMLKEQGSLRATC